MTRRAVVLLNLGGPLKREDIAPFLKNFFMDPAIIGAPWPIRWALSSWIAFSRSRGAAKTAYAELGYKSPLLENTKAQAAALEAELKTRGQDARVFVCMRYWHPMAEEVAKEVKAFAPDEIVLLPLYPQNSRTTSCSAVKAWARAAKAAGLKAPVGVACAWPLMEGFIAASADNIRAAFQGAPQGTRLLLSAHGLPEKIIRAGDVYQKHCEETAAAIAARLGLSRDAWRICYQSRVGPLKWIGPSTEEALAEAARDRVGVVIYPHAFVSEHVETLVELDIEYRHRAESLGIPFYAKAATVGTNPAFIAGLADLALAAPKPCGCAA